MKFAEMAVFSSRPETSAAMGFEPMDETLIPSALSRYQQIIFPVNIYILIVFLGCSLISLQFLSSVFLYSFRAKSSLIVYFNKFAC